MEPSLTGADQTQFRVISLPPFRAASSGVDKVCDFSNDSILGKFDAYFSAIQVSNRDSFMPRDFLYYDEEKSGLVWVWALTEDMGDGGNEVVSFDGGYYLTYVYVDGDDETGGKRYKEAISYVENSDVFELDIRPGHYIMGHIITPSEIIKAQGFAQMENFVPIKLKEK